MVGFASTAHKPRVSIARPARLPPLLVEKGGVMALLVLVLNLVLILVWVP